MKTRVSQLVKTHTIAQNDVIYLPMYISSPFSQMPDTFMGLLVTQCKFASFLALTSHSVFAIFVLDEDYKHDDLESVFERLGLEVDYCDDLEIDIEQPHENKDVVPFLKF